MRNTPECWKLRCLKKLPIQMGWLSFGSSYCLPTRFWHVIYCGTHDASPEGCKHTNGDTPRSLAGPESLEIPSSNGFSHSDDRGCRIPMPIPDHSQLVLQSASPTHQTFLPQENMTSSEHHVVTSSIIWWCPDDVGCFLNNSIYVRIESV